MLQAYLAKIKKLRWNNAWEATTNMLEDPLRLFVVLALIFGIGMLFTMPSFMVPDETVHFYRAYQVGEGHVLSEIHGHKLGGEAPPVPAVSPLPDSRTHEYSALTQVHPGEKFESFPSSALYSPLPYIPQAVGIDFARLIHPSIDFMVFMGRLCNLLVYILLVAAAIKIARQGKWVYGAVAIIPVAIQEGASLSTDVMTTGLCFVTIALIANLFLQKETFNLRQGIILGLLALGLGLTKQTNLFLLLPLLFLPKSLFSTNRKKFLAVGGIILLSVAIALLWYGTVQMKYHSINIEAETGIVGVDHNAQVKYLLHHPTSFALTLFHTYIFAGFKGIPTGDFFLTSMYGAFSWFLYGLPLIFVLLGYGVLLLVLLYRPTQELLDKHLDLAVSKLAVPYTLTFLLSLVAIAGALYVVWTPVGASYVSGIQGRYFIPIFPLLTPLFTVLGRYISVDFDKPRRVGVLVAIVSCISMIATLALTNRYFY